MKKDPFDDVNKQKKISWKAIKELLTENLQNHCHLSTF